LTVSTATQDGVRGRKLVDELAPADAIAALKIARGIVDPWYRCQALAMVARYIPEKDFDTTMAEALEACHSNLDVYKCVAVSAWPVRAAVERGQIEHLDRLVPELLAKAGMIQHPVSQLEGLSVLFQAVYPAGEPHRSAVFHAVRTACQGANSWKAGSRLAFAALMLAQDDPETAMQAISGMPESRYKRRALAAFADGEFAKPRRFF